MNLIEKYKILESNEKTNITLLFGYTFFLISIYIPYKRVISRFKIDETSVHLLDSAYYDTTMYGYESGLLLYVFIMTLLINMAGFAGEKLFNKILLFVITIFYLVSSFLIISLSNAGFGAPMGNSLYIGYYISLIGSIIITRSSFANIFRKQ